MVCSALAPSRHLGINAKYAKDWLWLSAGAFTQEVAGSEEWTNVADNNKDFGRNAGYSLTSKVVFRPLYKMDNASLHIGAAYSYRTTKVSQATGEWGTYRASARNSTSQNALPELPRHRLYPHHQKTGSVRSRGHRRRRAYRVARAGQRRP